MSGSAAKSTSLDSGAIYHDVSPTILSFILCLVKAHNNESYYLLACNLVLSTFMSIVVNWWYRGGALPADKFWYIFLLATVIIFQCITTDIYVFKVLPESEPALTTWVTINKTTMTPQSTRPPNVTTTLPHYDFLLAASP